MPREHGGSLWVWGFLQTLADHGVRGYFHLDRHIIQLYLISGCASIVHYSRTVIYGSVGVRTSVVLWSW